MCSSLRDLKRMVPQIAASLLLVSEFVQSCLEIAKRYRKAWNNALLSNSSLEKMLYHLKFTTDFNNVIGKSVSHRSAYLSHVSASDREESEWRMNRMTIGCKHLSLSQ
ncbi:hypothetical protein AVEN_180060-1 [Araneus ventricosus]|uniref:Uncharacterized protein n=1 Tax=Araneus ventricosus TaxID=182803 RepID=A0A4Y2KF77_ARAVE|nr:hypothetical protein AVEN_180060-1 [Araneus ventricosus]